MQIRLFLWLCFMVSSLLATAQQDCSNTGAQLNLNSAMSSYLADNFRIKQEWAVPLSSDQTYTLAVSLNAGYAYTFMLSAPEGVRATGIEIQDATGMQVQYDYKITEADNYILISDFLAETGGNYYILFKTVPAGGQACSYMAWMENDHPEDIKVVKKKE